LKAVRLNLFNIGIIFPVSAVFFCSCLDIVDYPDYLVMSPKPRPFTFANNSRTDIKNPYRYIAHAGGGIDGYEYTDSLEGLNASYAKGFRMFELDLVITRDGKIVAAHDWDSWKSYTGFPGEVPPKLNEFLQYKIFGLFTPISRYDIEDWFSVHTDCILVTDKITDFALLKKAFSFRDRIIIETFSLSDYVSAFKTGFKYPMLSLDSVKGGEDGMYMETFIVKNRVPLAVVPKEFKDLYSMQIGLINENKGYVFAFTSDDYQYLSDNTDLFGVYTNTIDFSNIVSETSDPGESLAASDAGDAGD
jgi:hypothetical protein